MKSFEELRREEEKRRSLGWKNLSSVDVPPSVIAALAEVWQATGQSNRRAVRSILLAAIEAGAHVELAKRGWLLSQAAFEATSGQSEPHYDARHSLQHALGCSSRPI